LAQQLARVGRYQEARPVFERVLKLEPGQPEASLGLADVLQKAGDHEAAVEAYRVALNYRSTTLAARLGSARSLVSLKRLEEARRMLEDGLGSHGSEPSLRLELSRVYARLGLTDLAAREAQFMNQLKAAESKP
jgi:predicted Zn-dependent protease